MGKASITRAESVTDPFGFMQIIDNYIDDVVDRNIESCDQDPRKEHCRRPVTHDSARSTEDFGGEVG